MGIISKRYLMMTVKVMMFQMSVVIMRMRMEVRVRRMKMTLFIILKIHQEMDRIQAGKLSSLTGRARIISYLTPVTMTAKPMK